ncbi:hypothetical protein [Halobacterium salinarum]|uniref:hypothetical protein n=1 Tax=Halobacterium salinarum TaxID=2242 RepID=UPI001F338B58|nr:hypothetical protein [Halobacterium salinarum]MCF2165813.1 hypothetical protein [Halobacterium salinarum]MCF2167418.1 hypothetical protein [Halobacterium salinarum]
MNRADPLDNLGSGDVVSAEIPPAPAPAPEDYEFEYPLVSERSKRDLQEFGLNMVDDYRDFKHELLSWLATYYDADGWVVRSMICNCGSRTIGLPTDGADEVIIGAVYWSERLAGVTIDRSQA